MKQQTEILLTVASDFLKQMIIPKSFNSVFYLHFGILFFYPKTFIIHLTITPLNYYFSSDLIQTARLRELLIFFEFISWPLQEG